MARTRSASLPLLLGLLAWIPGSALLAAETLEIGRFPALPPPEERVALNDAEREAGAVVLEHVIQLSGNAKIGFKGPKGWTRTRQRIRYLVLDAKGAERLTRHAVFGSSISDEEYVDIRGRTTTASNEEFPLDPEKDVRNLDLKDFRGRTKAMGRTAFFPHVEPGAILDLIWSQESEAVPGFQGIPLQKEFPVRGLRVVARGILLESSVGKAVFLGGPTEQVYWVPFFAGPVPPMANATLDSEFNLELNVKDLPPAPEEPHEPPRLRSDFMLGLIPEGFALTKKGGLEDWHRNLLLFGTPSKVNIEKERTTVSRDLDPGVAMVRLDELGLQVVPEWGSNEALMRFFLDGMQDDSRYAAKYLKGGKGAESLREIETIAPPSLPWKERTRRLYDHARSRLSPNPRDSSANRLSKALREGHAEQRDVNLYLVHLLRTAGISAKNLLAFSRFSLAFQPVVDSWRPFSATYLVEAAPPGEAPVYLFAGDPFANFNTFDDRYLGALAFREPDGEEEPWTLVRLPADIEISETVKLDLASPLPEESGEPELSLRVTAIDSAARWMRWRFGWKDPDEKEDESGKDENRSEERLKKTIDTWMDSWFGIEFKGEYPGVDPMKDVEGPLTFELRTPWSPDSQSVGEQLLVPALPQFYLFPNEFVSEARKRPIWLQGGRFEISFTWNLPPGHSLSRTPPAAERQGPGGMFYRMEVTSAPAEGPSGGPAVTTLMVLDLPRMLPAAEYGGVKEFYTSLQKTADTRLLLSRGP